jgi:hypothetical protein
MAIGQVVMFDEKSLNLLGERIGMVLIKWLAPNIEEAASQKLWPRWMSIETAGEYIDKTYEGMRYTLREFPKEIPISMVGDKPRIDKNDIDKFFLNRKRK